MRILHHGYLRGGLGDGVTFRIEGHDGGGISEIFIHDSREEGTARLTPAEFQEAVNVYRDISHLESPFETFQGAANMAEAIENQHTRYDGTRAAVIAAVRLSGETGTYGIEVAVADPDVEGGKVFTLWRVRDMRAFNEYMVGLAERTGRRYR